MRLLTFCTWDNPAPRTGLRHGRRILDLAAHGFPAGMKDLLAAGPSMLETLRNIALSRATTLADTSITWLPPVPDADKFLCVGKNYRTHLAELRANALLTDTPEEPTAFVKLNSCLVGHERKVAKPDGITRLDYEPELVFVIGKRALAAKREDALSYVAGVTILNDLPDRDAQH